MPPGVNSSHPSASAGWLRPLDCHLCGPGGDPSNPADIVQQLQVPSITLASQGVWNHVPYAITGGFALISIQHTGPHPAVIRPYVPEPSSALLALVGSTGLLGYVRRRRRS